jgi:DHA1 family multidrug resistance protein-like MFS transporter
LDKSGYQKILRLGFPFEVLNRDLRLLFLSNLFGSFGDGLYAYLLPYYMKESLKASSVEVGILYAVAGLVAAFTLLVAGMLADRYDRKKIMVLGWMVWVPAPIIFSMAENWFQMLPGMILWGFWFSGPTNMAYITTAADKSQLTLTFTMTSAAWSFGYIFSPALGGYLSGIVGMKVVFYSAFALYALAALSLFFITSQRAKGYGRKTLEERYSFFKLLKTRKLLLLSVFFALLMFVLMLFRPFVPQFLGEIRGYEDFEIGFLGSISFFGSAVLGILLGRLGDRWNKAYAIAGSMLLCCTSLTFLLLFDNFLVLIVVFFLAGSSYTTWSLMAAIVAPHAPESIRARWISVPQTVTMFASFIAPYIGGVIYEASSYYPFIIGIFATLVLALLALTKFHE